MILRVEIPNYIRRVKLSDKQITKYWEWDGKTIRCGSKKLLQQFVKKEHRKEDVVKNLGNIRPEWLEDDYRIAIFDKKKIVDWYDKNSKVLFADRKYHLVKEVAMGVWEKVVANPKQVGTPKLMIIRGQDFYNSAVREHLAGTLMQAIKQDFVPHVKDLPVIKTSEYPLRIKTYLFDTVKNTFDNTKDEERSGQRWDVGNRIYPYAKAFLDLLATGTDGQKSYFLPKLIDDDRLHVTEDPQGGTFCPIGINDTPKLVFIIATDDENYLEALKPIEMERLLLMKNCPHYAGIS